MAIKILVIGGGIAGLSVARDLVLHGFSVTIIDKQKIGNGTTTQCAGMLHSGARYAIKDLKTARLCFEENRTIRRIVSHAVGKRKAFFVRYKDDNSKYEEKFINGCRQIGIPIKKISGPKARQLEPQLGPDVDYVFETPDMVIDTFSLIFSYLHDLIKRKGVEIFEEMKIKKASKVGGKWKIDTDKNSHLFDLVINCSGDGLAAVGKMFGENIELSYVYGSMALFENRLSSRIVTRCAPNVTGDVVVPAVGATLIGSTWHERNKQSKVDITKKDEKEIRKTASRMLSGVSRGKLTASLTSVRTHLKDTSYSSSFGSKRNHLILDHKSNGKSTGFISVLPGKLTIARYVAEQVGNIVCQKFNINARSTTASKPIKKPKTVLRNFKFYLE